MSTLIEDVRDEVAMTQAWLNNRIAELRSEDPDRGSNSLDNVIWFALVAVAAVAIGAIIVNKMTDKANSTNLQ